MIPGLTLFPYFLLQSMRFCSERLTSFPVALWCIASRAPVVEKDQQDPHWPWFFTGVTAPFSLQSTFLGSWELWAGMRYLAPWGRSVLVLLICLYPFRVATNSWCSRSPNSFMARL